MFAPASTPKWKQHLKKPRKYDSANLAPKPSKNSNNGKTEWMFIHQMAQTKSNHVALLAELASIKEENKRMVTAVDDKIDVRIDQLLETINRRKSLDLNVEVAGDEKCNRPNASIPQIIISKETLNESMNLGNGISKPSPKKSQSLSQTVLDRMNLMQNTIVNAISLSSEKNNAAMMELLLKIQEKPEMKSSNGTQINSENSKSIIKEQASIYKEPESLFENISVIPVSHISIVEESVDRKDIPLKTQRKEKSVSIQNSNFGDSLIEKYADHDTTEPEVSSPSESVSKDLLNQRSNLSNSNQSKSYYQEGKQNETFIEKLLFFSKQNALEFKDIELKEKDILNQSESVHLQTKFKKLRDLKIDKPRRKPQSKLKEKPRPVQEPNLYTEDRSQHERILLNASILDHQRDRESTRIEKMKQESMKSVDQDMKRKEFLFSNENSMMNSLSDIINGYQSQPSIQSQNNQSNELDDIVGLLNKF